MGVISPSKLEPDNLSRNAWNDVKSIFFIFRSIFGRLSVRQMEAEAFFPYQVKHKRMSSQAVAVSRPSLSLSLGFFRKKGKKNKISSSIYLFSFRSRTRSLL